MPCSIITSMERRCEFCKEAKAVVFCKSDTAHLCLTCDAKVHSANALSYRHPRALVCESCRSQPAFVRCFDHRAFMCQSCDITHHLSLDHHKKAVSCYVGCPSAKDLAELWGFDSGGSKSDLAVEDRSADSDASLVYQECGGGSSSGGRKEEKEQKSSSYLILQQILDLKRSESSDDSCLARVKERACGSPFRHDATWKENSDERESEESLSSSPFSQMENFNSNGDSFWQCRSPLHNNLIWLQNMQDLGVCDEVQSFEDVNIPEVDPTFRSFEELFGNEQETSNEDQHPPFDRIEQMDDFNSVPPHPRTIKPSYSRASHSASRITEESSGSHYKEKKPSKHERQGQFTSPRTKSDFKRRGKNQPLKGEGFEGGCGSVDGSF